MLLPDMKNALFVCLVQVCFLSACTSSESNRLDTSKADAVAYALDYAEIDEASGLAASVVNKGMLWIHNDSGDEARIFLIDSLGRLQMTVYLDGVIHRDWEDIAVGEGPEKGKAYIYIGEIGDNFSRHEYKYIYRIEEPVYSGKELTVKKVDIITFAIPGGSRDAEALMIDPRTKDLYIFSKGQKAILYRLPYPHSTRDVIMAEQVYKDIPLRKVVAADWSPTGNEILVKTHRRIHYYNVLEGEPLRELLNPKPPALRYVREPQGEGIAYARNGRSYYSVGERAKGYIPELVYYPRLPEQQEK